MGEWDPEALIHKEFELWSLSQLNSVTGVAVCDVTDLSCGVVPGETRNPPW